MVALVKQKQTVAKRAATFVVSPTAGEGDYTSIQDAINALPTAGGTIFLREGTYSISSTITLPNKPVTVYGAGRDQVKIDLGSNAIAAFTIPNTATSVPFVFRGFSVLGNDVAGQIAFNLQGTVGYYNKPMLIEDVQIGDESASKPVEVFIQATTSTAYVQVRNAFIYLRYSASAYFAKGSGLYLYLDRVVANGYTRIGGSSAYLMELHATCCSISQPQSVYVQKAALFDCEWTSGQFYFGSGSRIIGCRFDPAQASPHITLYSGATNCVFTGNYFYGNVAYCIYLSGSRHTIQGNRFNGYTTAALYFDSATYVTVTGNCSCKVVEAGSADNNFFCDNEGFSGSTIIGSSSRVGHGRGVRTVSANTTLDETYDTVLVDASVGTRTITLPSASSMKHRSFTVKKIDTSSNPVRVIAASGESIDNNSEISLDFSYQSLTIVSDGSNWWAI